MLYRIRTRPLHRIVLSIRITFLFSQIWQHKVSSNNPLYHHHSLLTRLIVSLPWDQGSHPTIQNRTIHLVPQLYHSRVFLPLPSNTSLLCDLLMIKMLLCGLTASQMLIISLIFNHISGHSHPLHKPHNQQCSPTTV